MRSRLLRAATAALIAAIALLVTACSAPTASAPSTAAGSTSASSVSSSPSGATTAAAKTSAAKTSARTSPKPGGRTVAPTPAKATTPVPAPTTSASKAPPTPAPANLPTVSGTTIVLNPGHNGDNANNPAVSYRVNVGYGHTNFCDTTGTQTNAGYPEHAFNWDIAVRVRAILNAHGVKVIMTRPNDTSAGPCIGQRAAIGNEPGVAAVVSIHADGTETGVGHGFHISEDSRPPAGPVIAALSNSLTVDLHNSILASSGFTTSTYIGVNGYYPREDFGALNLATVPSTFLELGNMRNAGDAAIQTSSSGRAQIALSVATGILTWLASR